MTGESRGLRPATGGIWDWSLIGITQTLSRIHTRIAQTGETFNDFYSRSSLRPAFHAAVMAINYAIIRRKALKNAGQVVRDRLDAVLHRWSKDDPFTLRDLLNGGVAIFGRTGSGKTSSSW